LGKKKKIWYRENKIMRKFFLTLGFSGLSPKAPGTVGSLVALILGYFALTILSIETLFLLTLLISVVAVKQIDIYEQEVGAHDGKEIVIDELSGMWLTITLAGLTTSSSIYLFLVAFVFFRIFDIVKPSIIGVIDRKIKGGWGVMGDDMVAGVFAALCTSLVSYLFF